MKKLVLLLAVAFSVSMFSCGNGNDKAANDSDSVAAAEPAEAAAPAEQAEAPEVAPVDTPAVEAPAAAEAAK